MYFFFAIDQTHPYFPEAINIVLHILFLTEPVFKVLYFGIAVYLIALNIPNKAKRSQTYEPTIF